MTQLLIDTMPIALQLSEDSNGKLTVKGEFAFCGRPTANKRVYSESLMKREMKRLAERIQERKMVGELDHPSDGRTKLQRTSHLVTSLEVMDDGRVVGEAEPIDTRIGKDLQALLKSGAMIGVSSRGFGSTVTNAEGNEEVQEDFKLVTFDFVADPANATSYPVVQKEEKETDMAKTTEVKVEVPSLSELKKEFDGIARSVFAEGREELLKEFRSVLSEAKTEAPPNELQEMRSRAQAKEDDALAEKWAEELMGIRKTLAESEARVVELEEQNQLLGEAAREAAYKYYLERILSEDENSVTLRNLVGDVSRYDSKEALDEAIQEARGDVAKQVSLTEATDRRRQRELQIIEEDKSRVQDENNKLLEAVSKSSELNNLLMVELYAIKRLVNHPRGGEIQKVIESTELSTKADVDAIIESFAEPERDAEQQQSVRARIREITGGGVGPSALEEETGSPTGKPNGASQKNYNELGMSIRELKKLAGTLTPSA